MKDATHKDEFGNWYKVIGDYPQEYCVWYWDRRMSVWNQDLGKDFSHLIKIDK